MSLKSFIRNSFKKKRKDFYISDHKDLIFLEEELSKHKIFGLDTEFDWRTTYYPKLALIQISVAKKLFLIDCLKINPKNILKKFLEDKKILKIFHSVRSDATVLSKCLSIRTKNTFDIQQADKLLSNNEIKSYGKIVKNFFGINLEKSETNSNWLKRPLTDMQIRYALDDVDYLLEIYQYQKKELIKFNLFDKALLFSKKELNLGNESLKKLRLEKNKKKFSFKNREIFIWREDLAEENNVPPAFIFKNKHLNNLSKINLKDESAKRKVMAIIGDTEISEKFMAAFL
jgi:ribonuclease D